MRFPFTHALGHIVTLSILRQLSTSTMRPPPLHSIPKPVATKPGAIRRRRVFAVSDHSFTSSGRIRSDPVCWKSFASVVCPTICLLQRLYDREKPAAASPTSAAGQKLYGRSAVEAPGPQGATREHSGSYVTEEQRSGPGWIGGPTTGEFLTGSTRDRAVSRQQRRPYERRQRQTQQYPLAASPRHNRGKPCEREWYGPS
jgi:hypothetical protein